MEECLQCSADVTTCECSGHTAMGEARVEFQCPYCGCEGDTCGVVNPENVTCDGCEKPFDVDY